MLIFLWGYQTRSKICLAYIILPQSAISLASQTRSDNLNHFHSKKDGLAIPSLLLSKGKPCDVDGCWSSRFARTAAASSVGVAVVATDFFAADSGSLAGDFDLERVLFLAESTFFNGSAFSAFPSVLAAGSGFVPASCT